MDLGRALLIVELVCFIAFLNRFYRNEPLEETTKTCIEANRKYLCSLCAKKLNFHLDFPAPAMPANLPPLIPFPSTDPYAKKSKRSKKTGLTPRQREQLTELLEDFGHQLWLAERFKESERVCSSYFPQGLIKELVDNTHLISSCDCLDTILRRLNWSFLDSHGSQLYDVLSAFRSKPQQRTRKQAKSVSDEDEEPGVDILGSPVPPPLKQRALADATARTVNPQATAKPIQVLQPSRSKKAAASNNDEQQPPKFIQLMAEMGPVRTKRIR